MEIFHYSASSDPFCSSFLKATEAYSKLVDLNVNVLKVMLKRICKKS